MKRRWWRPERWAGPIAIALLAVAGSWAADHRGDPVVAAAERTDTAHAIASEALPTVSNASPSSMTSFAAPDRVATGTATPLITLPTATQPPPPTAPPTAPPPSSTVAPPPTATLPPPSRVTDGPPPPTRPPATDPPPSAQPTQRSPATQPPATDPVPPEEPTEPVGPEPPTSTAPLPVPPTQEPAATLERAVIRDDAAASATPIETSGSSSSMGTPTAVGTAVGTIDSGSDAPGLSPGTPTVASTDSGDNPAGQASSGAPATLVPTPFRQIGLMRVPLDDPGQRRAWAERGEPWAGVPLAERFTRGRPGPLGWLGTYIALALVFVSLVAALIRRVAREAWPGEGAVQDGGPTTATRDARDS